MHFTLPDMPTHNGNIRPNGNGHNFFYTPSNHNNLSPRSTSPDSSNNDSSSSGSVPRSLSSSPAPAPLSEPPPRDNTRIVSEANFILEEFGESDYEGFDSDEESVIRPHQYEDAESERAHSVKSMPHSEQVDSHLADGIKQLHCKPNEDDRDAWIEAMRAEKRRKRRSSSIVQKRTLSQSIGSDTDDEDLKPVVFDGANEAGSSARRLRRKVKGERVSLIFDDPPPRIEEEEEEPESVEEVVDCDEDEDDDDEGPGQRGFRELPYYYVQDMEVDPDSEAVVDDEDDEDDEDD